MKRALLWLLSFSLSAATTAQTLLDHWWDANGRVLSLVTDQANGVLYMGGEFSQVGPHVPYGVAVDTLSGQPQPNFPKPNGEVLACIPDGAGGWYIGGEFTKVNGQPRNRAARINANGSTHPWNPNANQGVYALARSGANVYLGGIFYTIGGQTRAYIACVDTALGVPNAWDPAPDHVVRCLLVDGSTVYAGGDFTSIGGAARSKVAALDATSGLALAWAPLLNSGSGAQVTDLLLGTSVIYLGGTFTSINGQSRLGLAAVDPGTGNPTTWTPSSNGPVYALAAQGSVIYAGGQFTSIGGQPRSSLAALDATTGLATSWDPGTNGIVLDIALGPSTLYACGNFTAVGGQLRNYVASVELVTGSVLNWDPNCGARAKALAQEGARIFVGGEFTIMGGVPRENLAALDIATGTALNWAPATDSTVQCMALHGPILYAGGEFSTVNGQPRQKLAAFDATTGLLTGRNPGADNRVWTMTLDAGRLYVGGSFNSVGGQSRNAIAELDAGTGIPTPWNPGINMSGQGYVYSIAPSGPLVYVGGSFSGMGGQNRQHLAAIDRLSGLATTWDPQPSSHVTCVHPMGSSVLVGGIFSSIGGQPRSKLAQIDSLTGLATSWDPHGNGVAFSAVTNIIPGDSTLLVGGSFYGFGGQTRKGLAELHLASGLPTPFNPLFGFVNELSSNDSLLFAGCSFPTQTLGQGRTGLCVYGKCRPLEYFADFDGDGYGDANNTILQCAPAPGGYANDSTDCNDVDGTIYPGATCDDGNANTIDDIWTPDCLCVGDLSTMIAGSDGSGTLSGWPNPAGDILFLSEPSDGRIIDAWGSTVLLIPRSSTISLTGLPGGVYTFVTSQAVTIRFAHE